MSADGLASSVRRLRAEIEAWLECVASTESADDAGPTIDPEAEIDAWLALDAKGRERLECRLTILSRLRREGRRGDATRVARDLKMSRSNVTRLLARMEEVGPITGLVTRKRVQVPRSVIRDGFQGPVEEALRDALRERPDASVQELGETLRVRFLRNGDDVELPGTSALRRRIEHLRQRGVGLVAKDLAVGARLLVDGCWLDMSIVQEEGRRGPAGQVHGVFALDLGTGLICGFHVHVGERDGGLGGLMHDFRMRLPDLARVPLPISRAMEEVRWIVPAPMAERASLVGAYVPAARRPRFDLGHRNVRRLGTDLLSEIGESLGGVRLVARPDRGGGDLREFPTILEPLHVVSRGVEVHNGAVLDRLRDAGAAPTVGPRGRPANVARAEELARDLVAAFGSVLDEDDGLIRRVARAYP
jgi:hypothetical protein